MMRFEELGREIAAVQDADRDALRDTERASVSYVRALRGSRARRATPISMAALVLGVAATGAFVWLRPPAVPQLNLAETPGVSVGRRIHAPENQPIPVGFSDGSRLVLAPGTQASVKALTGDGATIDVEVGSASLSVVHRPTTHWSVEAGPYRVQVTGTRFKIDWSPSNQHFELNLESGSVVVTSNANARAALTMTAPERLVVDHGDWQLRPGGNSFAEGLPENASNTPTADELERPQTPNRTTTAISPRVSPSATATAPAQADWQRLGRLGKFSEAYRSASEIGIANLADTEAATSMLTLAEVCRFSGHAGEATLVLTKLRERFGRSNEAAIAAFQLGRQSSDGRLAASWFRAYLKERPNGELAREASGRLLEALDRAGDHAQAEVAARNYLERYPTGPHADFARRFASP